MAKRPPAENDFVAKIVKDPKNPPATLMLTGFTGDSSEEGHTRLYFDPSLSNYVEIPDDAILHTQSAPAEGGLAATYVWIKRDAQLIFGPAGTQRPKGTFLDGPIMQAHMAGAAGGAAGAAAVAAPRPPSWPACAALVVVGPTPSAPPTPHCPPLTPLCPPTPFCPRTPHCPPLAPLCPPTPFCPRTLLCPQLTPLCPPITPV